MARGIEGRNIFTDDDDRSCFLTLLSEGISASGFKCYKIVAAVSHRTLEIPIREIAGYLNVDSSAVSKMLDEGERLAREMKIKHLNNSLNHLRPYTIISVPIHYTPYTLACAMQA
jgi:hypothetical protein